MLTEMEMKKLDTYFGFLKREKGFFVGRRLESEMEKDEVRVLILLPLCSEKSKADLMQLLKPDCFVLEYKGNIRIHEFLNQKEIKAVGIRDKNLGKVIVELLEKDMEDGNKGGC